MKDLKKYFITTERPFSEGVVEVFEQEIELTNIKKAVLTITALGVYEAQINGQKVGDMMFAPGYTYYPKEVQVQEYDVTCLMQKRNTLKVFLGQGWYCGRFTFENKAQIYGEKPAVSWALTVQTEDGEKEFTSRDGVVAVNSPYIYAGMYDGEVYDENGADGEAYQPTHYSGSLPEHFDQTVISVKVQEEMPVKNVTVHDGYTILDFGQNFAGFVEIDPAKMKGKTVKLRHGEILNADGSLYTANLRKAKAEISYTKGNSTQKYRPKFCYMGFRYVEVTGDYCEGMITAYAVYSEMPRTGEFVCANGLVQKLYDNQIWGQKSNYVEVPTDCPQRDERMGYTGDGHVFALTGAYNFDTSVFWRKFLRDIRYSQQDNSEGYVAPTIPAQGKAGIGFMSMLGWGNCNQIVPKMLYEQFGDDSFLIEQYDSMKAHVECEIRRLGKRLNRNLWCSPSLGDWLTLGKGVAYMAMHNGPVSNAFIVNDLKIMCQTARMLNKPEDEKRYGEFLEKVRSAYVKKFVKKSGKMKDDYQGAYIMALKFVLPEGELHNKVFGELVKKIEKEGMQTGFFATEHLLPLLADHGRQKLAYDLLLSEKCPGWLYQINAGATTVWERWDALRPDGTVNESKMSNDNMVSFNHYAFGSVGEFYYGYILGIKPEKPGYEEVSIKPYIDARLGSVKGSYLSKAGKISVEWTVEKDKVNLRVQTPTVAHLTTPDGNTQTLQKGCYKFTCSL